MTSAPQVFEAYPLCLEPQLSEKIWGGRRLAQFVNKTLPTGKKIGESWEAWEDSQIANGDWQGQTLHTLLEQHPQAVCGDGVSPRALFPLLFKYIDAQDDLSVQVHPDDHFAQLLEAQPYGKTEAWYIIHAEPGAQIVHGFKQDTDAMRLQAQLAQHKLADLLAYVPVLRGDVVFVPAGTVHAIGKGIVLAEIQQNSDTTYRLYDWQRNDESGRSRELHIEKSLQVCDLAGLHEHHVRPLVLHHAEFDRHVLVACRYFALELLVVRERYQPLPLNNKFQILSVLTGDAQILYGSDFAQRAYAQQGQTLLLPTRLGAYGIAPVSRPLEILRAYVPALRVDVIEPLLQGGHDAASIVRLGGPVLKHNDLAPLVQAKAK